uniref:Cilia-and flagella-associated protein 96 n=1 Tax=Gadus morhua TaxID=8049 RepID=A0A8C4ZPA3_GADMO
MPAGEGKSDMERLGVFQEMGYVSIGDKYVPARYRPFNEAAGRGRQMQTGGPRLSSSLQIGFFETTFQRIFESEALNEPLKRARQQRLQQARRRVGALFLPSDGPKQTCGSGSYYGTLSGPMKAMSTQAVPKKGLPSPGRNIYTSPPKKGAGSSYPNVTLSKTDLYTPDRYDRAKELLQSETATNRSKFKSGPFKLHLHPKDYFHENPYFSNKPIPPAQKPLPATKQFLVPFKPSSPTKQIGGMKAGTFDLYPSHSADPYKPGRPKQANPGHPTFWPAPGPKSSPVKSIVTLNVNRLLPGKYMVNPSVLLGNYHW